MLRNTMLLLAGLVVGITAGVPTATATANGAVLGQCLFNDECDGTLVCSGQYCRALCRADKDCDANERCLAPGTDHAACEEIPRPAAPGMIYGRVEAAFGVPPASCTVQIIGGASTSCNARGEFALVGVAAGRYELRVRAPNQGVSARTVIAHVNPGVAASLGAIHLPAQALGVADPIIDPSTAPVWPSPEKGKGKGKGDDGGKSNTAPKDSPAK
jgi:hypothetical protein